MIAIFVLIDMLTQYNIMYMYIYFSAFLYVMCVFLFVYQLSWSECLYIVKIEYNY